MAESQRLALAGVRAAGDFDRMLVDMDLIDSNGEESQRIRSR